MLARESGWLSTDEMLQNISRHDFNERYALAVLECREQRAAYGGDEEAPQTEDEIFAQLKGG